MSYFSAALDSIMRQRGMKQAQLAREAEIDQAQISRYLSGDNRPDARALERLCQALLEDSSTLLLGYVRDEIPAFARDRIDVISLSKAPAGTDGPSQPDAYARLSARARKLLNEFATKCESSPELVTALDSMLDLTREH
jgi:transcriptional regulator with XRE-family HTH domain